MPAIHAASVSTKNGRVATLREFRENGDEYNYSFEDGIIREAVYNPFKGDVAIHLEYTREKRKNNECVLEVRVVDMTKRNPVHKETAYLEFDEDYEAFNRHLKSTFESIVEAHLTLLAKKEDT